MTLNNKEIADLQKKYSYLINYERDDPMAPINPENYMDSDGDHLIHIAARQGDLQTVEVLIRAGQDINQIGDMGYTPLHCAYMSGNVEVIEFLLANGANKEVKNEFGQTPEEGV